MACNSSFRRLRLSCGPVWRVVLALCVLASGGMSAETLRGQERDAPVVVVPIIQRDVNSGQRVVGTVMPLRSSVIGSAVEGRVVEYLVDHGEPVRDGQPLAKLRTQTLEIELAASRAELTLYEEQLAELNNGSRPEEIAEQRAKMLGAKAVMQNAATKLSRTEELAASGAISADEVGDARERSVLADQLYRAAEALFQRIKMGPRAEQIHQAQAQVELQRERVRLIEDRIAKHTIPAPFDGFVAAKHTEVGAWIRQGDPIAQVIELKQVEIHTPVPAEHAVQLREGAVIRVEFPELPGELFTGTVTRIVPTADTRTRTFPVYVRMENRVDQGVPLLMAGMLARMELPTGRRLNSLLVPKDALVLDGSRSVVFVVQPDSSSARTGVVEAKAVQLGVADGGLIQIRGAVSEGQLVVVEGNERLVDQQRVQVAQIIDHPVETENAAITLRPRD